MKFPLLSTFLVLCQFGFSQTLIRSIDESSEDFVQSTLQANDWLAGPTYEYQDSNMTAIIYFPIHSEKKVKDKPGTFNLYNASPSYTLFKVLYSTDHINYESHVIDTLDYNSACCPCYFPAVVDSIIFPEKGNFNDLIVLQTNPVRNDCSSVTSYYAFRYTNLIRDMQLGIFQFRHSASTSYFPFQENRRKIILKKFKELETY